MSLIPRSFLLLTCIFPLFLYAQRIEFISEDLVFTIEPVFFTVNGDYCFRNPSNSLLTNRIYYPVAGNTGFNPFDSIMVFDISSPSVPLIVEIKDSIANFAMTIPPFSEKCVRVFYRQRHNGIVARYILTTTKNWGKSLESAKYTLTSGKNMKLTWVSIPPDNESEFDDMRLYTWKRAQFMPEADFVFTFRPAGGK